MTMNRAQVDNGGNNVRPQNPGDAIMAQRMATAVTTVGNGSWPAAAILGGIIDRSGPAGAYQDTPDTADNLIAACPPLSVGDQFEFYVRNTVAFANTVQTAEGVELGSNTAIAASKVRKYRINVMSNARRRVCSTATTNGSPSVTVSISDALALQPGMGVSGTGIAANSVVLAVNSITGVITLNNNATATGTAGITYFPRVVLNGISSADL